MRLSATRIQTYLQCPRRYRFTYIDKVRVVPSAALVFGKVLHAVLHDTHTIADADGESISLAFAVEQFERLWQLAVITESPRFGDGPLEPRRYVQLGADILVGYVLTYQDRPPALALEMPFTVACGEHELTGYIDRVEEAEDGLVLTDFKTGKRKPSPSVLGADLQLTIYAFALQAVYHRPVSRIVYYQLRDQSALQTRRTSADFDCLTTATVPHVAAGIEAAQFPAQSGWWCKACDFASLCKAERQPDPTDAPIAPQ
jgi:putative RecB family exonuclease